MKSSLVMMSEDSVQNSLMQMQDKERGAQARSVHMILEDASTEVTQSCVAAVEFATGSTYE